MKKIIMAIMAGILLMGCATTSGTTGKKNNSATTSGTKKTPQEMYEEENIKKVSEILNRPILEKDDFKELAYASRSVWNKLEFPIIKTKRTDFTIRIQNKTNKDIPLWFISEHNDQITGERTRRNFYKTLHANKTESFNIPDFIKLKDYCLLIFVENGKKPIEIFSLANGAIQFGRREEQVPLVEELVKNHSMEFIYDYEEPVRDRGLGFWEEDYEVRFIEPFECEPDMKCKYGFF